MPALFHVSLRAAKAADQEVLQPLFGSGQVVGGVHRPENVVTRYLSIERGDETCEAVLADLSVNLTF
jgi:hypothetical protein